MNSSVDPRHLSKNAKLRFAVAGPTPDTLNSSSWTAWIRGNDLYIAPQDSGHLQKISIHASGECRYAFTSPAYSHMPSDAASERVISRWTRGDTRDCLHTHVLDLNFLIVGQSYPEKAPAGKKIVRLVNAPPLFATQVAVFYSDTNPLMWSDPEFITRNIIGLWGLPSGLFATFRTRVVPFPDSEFQNLLRSASGRSSISSGEPSADAGSPGMSTMMLSRSAPYFGEVFIVEKVSMAGMMGVAFDWSKPSSELKKPK